MKVSIIIPAYNEEKRIENTLEEYYKFFKNLKKNKKLDFEIVVVINNTRDKTPEIVDKFSKEKDEIIYLNFKQGGKGFAIIAGFKDALKRENNLIGFVDADMATPPEAFYDLIKNIGDYDGIIASRWIKGSVIKTKQNLLRKIYSKGFNFIIRSLFLINFRDTQCGAKLFKRSVVEKIVNELNITQWAFDVNVLYLCKKNRSKIKEFPTIWEDKKGSKLDVTKVPIQMFSGVVRLRLIYSPFERILKPIRSIAGIAHRIINKGKDY